MMVVDPRIKIIMQALEGNSQALGVFMEFVSTFYNESASRLNQTSRQISGALEQLRERVESLEARISTSQPEHEMRVAIDQFRQVSSTLIRRLERRVSVVEATQIAKRLAPEIDDDVLARRLAASVDTTLALSVRCDNMLRCEGIATVGEVVCKSDAELLRVPNFGRRSLTELREEIRRYLNEGEE